MSNYDYDYDDDYEDYDFDFENNELKSHKKRDKIKWIITAIAFILVFALIGGLFAVFLRSGDGKKAPESEQVETDVKPEPTPEPTPEPVPDPEPEVKVQTHTLSFNDVELRTSHSEQEQIWKDDGIVFTNQKGSGTKIGDYYNPVRLYTHSIVKIECAEMTEIAFYCTSASYVKNLLDSMEGMKGFSKTVSDFVVTVIFENPADTFEMTDLAGQVQVSQIVVKANIPTPSDDAEKSEEDNTDDDADSQEDAEVDATTPADDELILKEEN